MICRLDEKGMRRTDRAICFPLCAQAALRSEALRFPRSALKRLVAATYQHLLPLLLYTALALLMTWPLALQFTNTVPGNAYDSWQNMWNMWWLKEALLHGHHPYFTPMLYYPHGASLLLHTLNPINFLISLPVHALFGLVVAYNFVVIVSLTASGYTAYLLAHNVTGDRWAALVAGTIFATSGYLLSQALGGHTHMLAAQFLPLAVLALRRLTVPPPEREPARWSRRDELGAIMLAGVALAVNLLADWQYFLFILIWAAWYALTRWWAGVFDGGQRAIFRLPRDAQRIGLAIGVALVLALPLAIPTARLADETPTATTEGGDAFRLEHSLDLADFFIPSQLHPLWGHLAERWQASKSDTHIQNKTAYLGLVTLVLAGWGLRQREGRFWLLSALVFALLAMGPRLQMFGTITNIPLPGAMLYELPLIRISRYPMRFVVITMLALALLAALGVTRLRQMLAERRQRACVPSAIAPVQGATSEVSRRSAWIERTIMATLIALIILDNLVAPFPLAAIYVPAIYAELSQDPEDFAILEAPFYYRSSPVYMLFQIIHGKPLVGGYTSRTLSYPLLDQIPLIRMFAYAEPAYDIIGQRPTEIASSVLDYFNIRYVMLHSTGGALRYNTLLRVAQAAANGQPPREEVATVLPSDARTASGLRRTFGRIIPQAAGSVLIYRVQSPAEPLPFLGIGQGWSEPVVQPDGVVQRQITESAELLIYSAHPHDVTVTVRLHSPGAGAVRLSANGHPLPPVALQAGMNDLQISLTLTESVTRLELHPDGTGPLTVEDVDLSR